MSTHGANGMRGREPDISPADAADICAQPWPDLEQAMEQVVALRRAGWRVPELVPPLRRTDGIVIVASVYHPHTLASPGSVGYRNTGGALESERARPE